MRWRFIILALMWCCLVSNIYLAILIWSSACQETTIVKVYSASIQSEIIPKTHPYLITFVSGFIDIGSIEKIGDGIRHKSVYFKWVEAYGQLNSPMVFYSNSQKFLTRVSEVRQNFKHLTKLFYIKDVKLLPGFSHFNETQTLFKSPEYPKVPGITTNPKYSCTMHSKYDFLAMSIEKDYFKTPYIAWTDVGSVRYMGGSKNILNVTLPPKFNDSRVAFNVMNKLNVSATLVEVMSTHSVWVTGNFFMGKMAVMSKFVQQYRQFVDKMIAMNLMSTDENILYAMYTKEGHSPDMVDIQLYHGPLDICDSWFHMMYLVTKHPCLRKKDHLRLLFLRRRRPHQSRQLAI